MGRPDHARGNDVPIPSRLESETRAEVMRSQGSLHSVQKGEHCPFTGQAVIMGGLGPGTGVPSCRPWGWLSQAADLGNWRRARWGCTYFFAPSRCGERGRGWSGGPLGASSRHDHPRNDHGLTRQLQRDCRLKCRQVCIFASWVFFPPLRGLRFFLFTLQA